ncbi:MAG: diacylglycerol kinase family protein [Candidatus Falkowbacteria bacterium]|nr:diacylglycerol kinase family protein [Candidatus Falkowbacteria bacterium]
MYLYLYDSFLYTKNHSKVLDKIESRLTDLNLNGLSIVIDSSEKTPTLIEKELNRGVTTVIIIGNDYTIKNVMRLVGSLNPNSLSINNVAFAIIPVGKTNNEIAESFGVLPEEKACDCLAQRRLVNLDLGIINESIFFLTDIFFTTVTTLNLLIDDNYSIDLSPKTSIRIVNLAITSNLKQLKTSNINSSPDDGWLEIIIQKNNKNTFSWLSKTPKVSVIKAKNIKIIEDITYLQFDSNLIVKFPKKISVLKQRLNFIVGKDRVF